MLRFVPRIEQKPIKLATPGYKKPRPVCVISDRFFTVLLLDNSQAIIMDKYGDMIARVHGIPPPLLELNELFSDWEGACGCSDVADAFIDVLNDIEQTKSSRRIQQLRESADKYAESEEPVCEECQKHFQRRWENRLTAEANVFGPNAVPCALAMHATRSYRESTKNERRSAYGLCLIQKTKNCLEFAVFGSHSEVTVFSVPMWTLRAASDGGNPIVVLPSVRLCGQFDTGLLFEDYDVTSQQKKYGYLQRPGPFARRFALTGQLRARYDVQDVRYDQATDKLVLLSWYGGLQNVAFEIPEPFINPSFSPLMMDKYAPLEYKKKTLRWPTNSKQNFDSIYHFDSQLGTEIDQKVSIVDPGKPTIGYFWDGDQEVEKDPEEEFVVAGEDLCLVLGDGFIVYQSSSFKIFVLHNDTKIELCQQTQTRTKYLAFFYMEYHVIGVRARAIDVWKLK